MTGSLDNLIKVYNLENNGEICHQFRFDAGVVGFDLT